MKLTVLGCYGPYPAAGGACSGYLLEEKGFRILLDCGSGVLSRLQQHLQPWELEAALLSHLHFDHTADLTVLRYALDFARREALRFSPLPLYAPPEPAAEFKRLQYKELFEMHPVSSGETLMLGPFALSFLETVHSLPCLALRVETETGVLVYSGDTEYFEELAGFAAGADLFLCEANFQEMDLALSSANHLSAAGAARLAARAGVKRLLLTHFHPERRTALSLEEARLHFDETGAAQEGRTYRIPG